MTKKYSHDTNSVFYSAMINCPSCGHQWGIVYLPDALDKPVECECRQKDNSIWLVHNKPEHLCPAKWGFALDEEAKERLHYYIQLVKERDSLGDRIREINTVLKIGF